MSTIAGEITRIQGAKNDLATSITNKGVTVPAATKIDGYAALVDQIQQGGGTENAFMQMTDLTGIFAFKSFDNQTAYKEGLTRYAQNAITNLTYAFYLSKEINSNNSDILNLIAQVAGKNSIVDFNYAFCQFTHTNSASYNKTLDLSNLRVSGIANNGFESAGINYGTLVIVLNSESFKNATNVSRLFYDTKASIKIKLNESKVYLNNSTNDSYTFGNMSRQGAFIDSNNNPITEIDIYLAEGSVNASNMFLNNQTFERINLHNNFQLSNVNGMFQGAYNLKSATGLNFSRISGTNNVFGTSSYHADFGELGIVSGSAIGSANSTVFGITKIWNATADTVRDGQTIGYWYEKFANALGNKTVTGTVTITINTTLYNSLTAVQKQLITDKGYTLAYAS